MRIPIEEQETSISFSRNDGECFVYTSDATIMTRLDKLVAKSPEWELVEEYTSENVVVGKKYRTNKKLISFREKRSKGSGRTMTEEQKALLAQKLKEGRERKKREQDG